MANWPIFDRKTVTNDVTSPEIPFFFRFILFFFKYRTRTVGTLFCFFLSLTFVLIRKECPVRGAGCA